MKCPAFRTILLVVAGSVFLFSATMVTKHNIEMQASTAQTESIIQMAVTPVSEPKEPTIIEATTTEVTELLPEHLEEVPVSPPIQVDFDALCASNPDVIAWIFCPDTPINYPIVQASDNDYYLRRLLDGSRNTAGTLFMDYRNDKSFSDWNSIIYGHNLNNDSMFGTLPNYDTQAYFDAHPELFLLTPEQNYVIKLFAGFTTSADDELYSSFSPDEAQKTKLISNWLESSDFLSQIEPSREDRLITLSTCSYAYNNARYVLVGVQTPLS